MNTEYQSLYMKDNKGATRCWKIKAEDNRIIWQYGILNGVMQTKAEIVPFGKAGRTTDEQVMLQMASKIKSQRMKGYNASLASADSDAVNLLNLKKPMLAKALKSIKRIEFVGAYVQPKFDGNRCIITKQQGKMMAYSRNGKVIAANLDHIFIGLDLDEGDYVDGELYCHGESLQTIVSWVKRNQPNTLRLNFHAYDMMANVPYIHRYGELIRKCSGSSVIIAPTDKVNSIEEVWEMHKDFTSDGYEGAIIRWSIAGYEDGKRSNSLVKVKTFLDDVFKVIDILPSKDGWAILECLLSNGNTFRVSAPGSVGEKEDVYNDKWNYMGKYIRVEYMNLTKDGIPFHPIATNWID